MTVFIFSLCVYLLGTAAFLYANIKLSENPPKDQIKGLKTIGYFGIAWFIMASPGVVFGIYLMMIGKQ